MIVRAGRPIFFFYESGQKHQTLWRCLLGRKTFEFIKSNVYMKLTSNPSCSYTCKGLYISTGLFCKNIFQYSQHQLAMLSKLKSYKWCRPFSSPIFLELVFATEIDRLLSRLQLCRHNALCVAGRHLVWEEVSMVLLCWQNISLRASFSLKSACLLVHEDGEALQKFEVLITDVHFFEGVTGDVIEGFGHIRERFPSLPGTPFSLSKKD